MCFRIDWLQQGSRELFGTVIEDQIYFLIDTSASMQPHIQFVKDKLFILMQEQLRHKQKFNFIAYDSKAYPWRDRQVCIYALPKMFSRWHLNIFKGQMHLVKMTTNSFK